MKVSQMIKNLQEFKKKYGDLDCWYAVDDEGNDYHEVYWPPSLCYLGDDEVYSNMEDAYDCDLEPKDVQEICIVN